MKLNSIIRKLVGSFLLFVSYIAFAQGRPGGTVVNPGGGGGAVAPGAVPKTPIDMYEGALLMVAVVMMVGYYLYTRNRKAIA